jgi:hypothetical protein
MYFMFGSDGAEFFQETVVFGSSDMDGEKMMIILFSDDDTDLMDYLHAGKLKEVAFQESEKNIAVKDYSFTVGTGRDGLQKGQVVLRINV